MAIEVLLYGITALVAVNGLAVLMAAILTFKSIRVEDYRRAYWREMLDKAKREVGRDEPTKQPD